MTGRLTTVLAGVVGGLVALAIGAVLLATGVVDIAETTREVVQPPITRPAADDSGEGLTVNEIYRRTAPGVVFVQARGGTDRSPFGLPQGDGGMASGSGFVIDDEGFIVTNAHVVEGSDEVRVRFGEGALVDAEVVGQDLSTDLAVLKVDLPKERLEPLELGDSGSVRVGDPAIAIGAPFGFDRTVTTGIVSAKQREIKAPNNFSIDDVLQTDASVNPGNSGGPLLDAAGRVIGVNSQIATGGSRGSVGIAFAVPIDLAKKVVPQLKEDGEIDRAYLGVTTAPVADVAADLNLPVAHGALVQEVQPGTPAARAGLRAGRTETAEGLRVGGDLIVKVDGRDVREPQDIAAAIADKKPGDRVEVTFFRGKRQRTVTVELAKRPSSADAPSGRQRPPRGGGGEVLPFP